MPKNKTTYSIKWKDEKDISGNKIGLWCQKENDHLAKCLLCDKVISISTHGITALKNHAKTKSHRDKILNESQSSTSVENTTDVQPSTSSSQDHNDLLDEQIITAEAIWCAIVAEHDASFLISDHVTKNVYKMFPGTPISAGFKCCRTKTNYMICDGMAVDLQSKLLNKLRNVPFSLCIDESNKQYGKKFLCAMVKFFDDDTNSISIRFLDIFVCNDGDSDNITQKVVEMFVKNLLPFENLIHIMTDNPNVMRGKYKGVVKQITSKHANHLIDIGGCSLHHIANAVSNSLPELHRYEQVEDFVQDISSFFSFHVQFAEKFSNIQEIFNLDKHKLLKYCKVRFLSIYPVVGRVIEQFKPVQKLFLDEIPKNHPKVNKQLRVIRICETLKHSFTLPTLHFILFVLQNFQKYEKLFQREEPTIHLLYDKQVDLFRGTLIHFCIFSKLKPLRNSVDLVNFEYKDKDNIKPLNEISIGIKATEFISHFSEQDKTLFLSGVNRFYTKLCDEMLSKLSLKNKFLGNLRFLKPDNITQEGQKMITCISQSMPPVVKLATKDLDALSVEWQLLMLEDLPDFYKIENNKKVYIPIDKYWGNILDMNTSNENKYPIIEKVVKFALSIAEANAGVERMFSQLFHIITKDRNQLATHTIKGLLITKSYLKSIGNCTNFEIDESMMYHLKASRSKYVERNLEKNEYKRDSSIEKKTCRRG